jgi:Ser/Thr protein kinase RdoA (MazF antagonist)
MSHNNLTDNHILNLVSKFKIDTKIASVKPFGSGHINDTYRITNSDPNGPDYLLQRINHHVFRDVPVLMNNLLLVLDHLKKKLKLIPGADPENETLTLVETRNNQAYFKDDDNNYWRVFHFLKGTKSYDLVETEKQAFEGGKAFGRFQALLSDLDTSLVKDTIPDFHHIGSRLNKLQQAIDADTVGRVKLVLHEIDIIKRRADKMSEILTMGKAGILPLRITHNDTKFNNVLLDSEDNAQCVIDLDTVMPGYAAYDFGDSIRTIINTAAEDEPDLNKIGLNIPLFEAYTRGYLQEATGFLTEIGVDSLIKGVLLLPYIQAVRFLTDYLDGDHYFKIHTPQHNLQRAKAQLTLVKKLEENQEELQQIILKTYSNLEQ